MPFSQFIDSDGHSSCSSCIGTAVHTVQKTAETPQVTAQFLEVVDMLVMCNDWCGGRDRALTVELRSCGALTGD